MQVRNPEVVPSAVSQCSWVLVNGVSGPAAGAEPWDTVELPDSLRGAVPKRQRQFRAGRFCAARALRMLDPALADRPLARAPSGAPAWPAGVTGSITHTDDFVSAAAAWSREVAALGIDSERIVDASRARTLALTVATAEELTRAAGAGLDLPLAFTLVFSAKEATYKCLHASAGRFFGFHDVRLAGVDARARTFDLRLERTLSASLPAGTMLQGRFEIDTARVHTGVTRSSGRLDD